MARTGRPRGFDKDEAVGQAMMLFWDQGYEATSLAQLKAAMGDISPASFYAAFGSKEALFSAVLDLYLDTHGRVSLPLSDPALPPRDAIEKALRLSARMQTDRTHPLGCLVVQSASTCSPGNRHIQARLAAERDRNRARLRGCVERAIALGELPRSIDPAGFAATFDTFLVGLATQARDQVPLAALEAAVTGLMRVWDVLSVPAEAPVRPQR